jgi:hypothetical protein
VFNRRPGTNEDCGNEKQEENHMKNLATNQLAVSLKLVYLTIAAILLVESAHCYAETAKTFRIVHVHVIDTRQQPAANRKIRLVGLERWCLQQGPIEDTDRFWRFVTDAHGNVDVPIGNFASWEGGESRPGWGAYKVVAEGGPEDAGGISDGFWFDESTVPGHQLDPITKVPPGGADRTIKLQEGFTLQGRIVDDQDTDKPLVGLQVDTNCDLELDTHTGHGGAFLFRHATTDAQGNFRFRHLFPDPIHISLSPVDNPPAVWIKTWADGKWEDGVDDVMSPTDAGGVVQLEIGASVSPHFSYSGRVLNSAGQPVVDAKVQLLPSRHPQPDYDDEHGLNNLDCASVATNSKGGYRITSSTPWANSISADSAGHQGRVYNIHGDTLPPGHYDLKLSP